LKVRSLQIWVVWGRIILRALVNGNWQLVQNVSSREE
jgi:hypothetical protein